MKEIKAYIRNQVVERVLNALAALPDAPGVTLVSVQGFGHPKDRGPHQLVERTKLEIVVSEQQVEMVVNCIVQHAQTGAFGDGKIFISTIETAIHIRTDENGEETVETGHPPGTRVDK